MSNCDSEKSDEFSSWVSLPLTLGPVQWSTPSREVLFQGEDGFDHLRKYTRNGSEFFKEVIGVLEERVELEEHYAKGLQKLSARLMKATKNAVG